jgi:hypothetical protein
LRDSVHSFAASRCRGAGPRLKASVTARSPRCRTLQSLESWIALLGLLAIYAPAFAQQTSTWRQATESELRTLIPARAPVENEHIETEFRTASAITDGKGSFVGGVVLITAGYAAEGKYSNFLIVQTPLKIGSLLLSPGEYVFGWRRKDDDNLSVSFYEAHTGRPLGEIDAHRLNRIGKIESFRISPPGDKAFIQIGRFGMSYSLAD